VLEALHERIGFVKPWSIPRIREIYIMISSKAPSWISIALVALVLTACSSEQAQQMRGPPDRLTIYVTVEDEEVGNGRTVSRFVVQERGRVTFHNKDESRGALTLRFFRNEDDKREQNPFCQPNGEPEENPVVIQPGERPRRLIFCPGLQGQSFKYEATIGTAAKEDPIFFVE